MFRNDPRVGCAQEAGERVCAPECRQREGLRVLVEAIAGTSGPDMSAREAGGSVYVRICNPAGICRIAVRHVETIVRAADDLKLIARD
jgi:hypothetical protein